MKPVLFLLLALLTLATLANRALAGGILAV